MFETRVSWCDNIYAWGACFFDELDLLSKEVTPTLVESLTRSS